MEAAENRQSMPLCHHLAGGRIGRGSAAKVLSVPSDLDVARNAAGTVVTVQNAEVGPVFETVQ